MIKKQSVVIAVTASVLVVCLAVYLAWPDSEHSELSKPLVGPRIRPDVSESEEAEGSTAVEETLPNRPKGIPPSQRLRANDRETSPVEKTSVRDSPSWVKPGVPGEPHGKTPLLVSFRVTANESPIRGAAVDVQPLFVDAYSPIRAFVGIRYLRGFSDADGVVISKTFQHKDMTGETRFGVAAFHPDHGTAYQEVTFEEILNKSGEFQIELEAGQIVRGRAIDPFGNPINKAMVALSCAAKVGEISYSGLAVLTDKQGFFSIPGIGAENIPSYALIRWFQAPNLHSPNESGELLGDAIVYIGKHLFDEASNEWFLGDVKIE